MKKFFNVLSVIALLLTVLGAVNWLTIAALGFNFVTWVSFGTTWLETLLYVLVGIAGVYTFIWLCFARFQLVNSDSEQDYRYTNRAHNNY